MMRGITVTVGVSAVNLRALAIAIDPTLTNVLVGSSNAREFAVQSDPANTGNIYFGDASVHVPAGGQRCAYNLAAGGTALHRSIMEDVPFEEWWAVASVAAQLVNILFMRK